MSNDPILIEVPPEGGEFSTGGLFPMPRRHWTPNPIVVAGSIFATPGYTPWLVVTPAWRCSPVPWPGGWVCPTFDACAVHGPRCTGSHSSGEIYQVSFSARSLPRQTVAVPDINPTYDGNGTWAMVYRTKYPYMPGSLTVTFQGIALTKEVDFIEIDPALGTFQILRFLGQDNAGDMSVHYQWASQVATTGAEPGTLPYEDGEVPPPPVPGPGGVYRPANQRQFGWGTAYDGVNCNMACSAMLLDRHTMGRNTRYVGTPQSTPPMHRFYSGVTAVTGTGHDDARRAWTNGWGESYTYPGNVSWAYFVTQVQSGRAATVFGRYGYMDSTYKKSQTFNGPHAIYINEQLSDGTFWGYDPIVGYPIVYPYSVLKTYADSYNGFNDRIQAGYSRITPRIDPLTGIGI